MTFALANQILAVLGVIASIGLTWLQIRRNTLAPRAAAHQTISGRFSGMWLNLVFDPGAVDLRMRGSDAFQQPGAKRQGAGPLWPDGFHAHA